MRQTQNQNCLFLKDVDTKIAAYLIISALLKKLILSPLVIIVPNVTILDTLFQELTSWKDFFLPEVKIMLLPEAERGKLLFPGAENCRARALNNILQNNYDIIIGTCHAFLGPAPTPEENLSASITLKLGTQISPNALVERLVTLDYDDEYEVTVTGEFAKHGGILDVFSPACDFPCRIEFFGNEIDSLRCFDPKTQRTEKKISEYQIIGRSGVTAGGEADSDAFEYLSSQRHSFLWMYPALCQNILNNYASKNYFSRLQDVIHTCHQNNKLNVFLDSIEEIPVFLNQQMIFDNSQVSPLNLEYNVDNCDSTTLNIAVELMKEELTEYINNLINNNCKIIPLIKQENDKLLLKHFIKKNFLALPANIEIQINKAKYSFESIAENTCYITQDTWCAVGLKLDRYNDAEVNVQIETQVSAHEKNSNIKSDFSLTDLEEGDYVVHIDYGIGIFRGLKKIKSGNSVKEMIAIEYADDQIIYVSLLQANKLNRYIGAVGKLTLHKIGGKRWNNEKIEAKSGIRSYAAEMLRFQAMRQSINGIAFKENTYSMQAFIKAFPFPDTKDQSRATLEISSDMQSKKPMDRLLCGDVGYGKTEIAMRAAFRAVTAGYQVAVLAPTTVLAQQHYRTFLERFSCFNIKVGVLSRLRTAAEQITLISKIHKGEIDIIIGTHRLCSASVVFKNLGLVIIDEEQRFGVKHKERLRRYRAEADVLTMSATPIPRTLYMAMAGARDLSTLMTPPKLRLPVKTVIAPQEPELVINSIKTELARGGQVYYLHNRVNTIEKTRDELQTMLPQAIIATAHGQMKESELEERMTNFLTGNINVLVCSTIIESGLDVPNANTIIIEHAERFGLAELYQLRGRVGRWKRQSYCYLLLPKHQLIGTDARKRLNAIRRCTNLGAGFQLALNDLEIRGSGNILGSEQSGHLNSIGFDLYCNLLQNEILKMQGKPIIDFPEVELQIDFISFAYSEEKKSFPVAIPPDYIGSERIRISIYRRLSSMHSEEQLSAFKDELLDRFGKVPLCTINLLELTRCRILTGLAGYHVLNVMNGDVSIYTPGSVVYRLPNGKIPHLNYADPPPIRILHLINILHQLPRK